MAFPTGWPPRKGSGQASIRFYQTGTATAAYADNGYLFIDGVGANPYTPLPYVRPGGDVSKKPTPVPTVIPTNPAGTGAAGNGVNSSDAPKAMIWSETIRIQNTGLGLITFSFDGTNDHGTVPAGETFTYSGRREAGIAIKGTTDFTVEAW
jgi:hypothetical protein